MKNLVTFEDLIDDLIDEFNGFGFVPKKKIAKIQKMFLASLKTLVEKFNLEDEYKNDILSSLEVRMTKQSPKGAMKIQRKEATLKKSIHHLEDEIALIKNNLGFFADSKKANSLKASFEEKLVNATNQLEELKKTIENFTFFYLILY